MIRILVGGVLLAVGSVIGWSMHTTTVKPNNTDQVELAKLREQVSRQNWQAFNARQDQERTEADAKWNKMWDDMSRDSDARERERRAYELGQADGEGYAEQQARSQRSAYRSR